MKTLKLLTKSRFKVALDCETKLYYLDKEEYANEKLEDSFLESLAEGGFQVGALAKCYYPEGIEVTEREYEKSVQKTNELLEKKEVVIFEAAFRYKDLFVRTDILEKKGKKIRIIEVKSASYDPSDNFLKNNFINSSWSDYLYDIAFQKYVVMKSFDEKKSLKSPVISAFLMLADKSKSATVDGLNQKFLVLRDKDNRPKVKITGNVSLNALGDKILTEVSAEDALNLIYNSKEGEEELGDSFENFVKKVSKAYKNDTKIISPVGKKCKDCEFIVDSDSFNNKRLKSGFEECWKEQLGFNKKDFKKQLVYNIWNYKSTDKMFAQKRYFIDDLEKEDFKVTDKIAGDKISFQERQWIQAEKYKNNDNTPFILKDSLKKEMGSWVYPLHFIDFETTMVAIPFNKGLRPYEGIAFQYSHHIVYKDGTIEHKGEYINDTKGEFPSYKFLRSLKNELEKDNGTIFRYGTHENTYLNFIYRQLKSCSKKEIPDRDELIKWIQSISAPTKTNKGEWLPGERNMIDLRIVVLDYYYNPLTNGSNSIKDVLPAVLNTSKYLQKKYSKPIYGAKNGIKSINYNDWTWIKFDNEGNVINPYKLLPPVFNDTDNNTLERLFGTNELAEGGAAMTAYARMQFSEISDNEREELKTSLLKYCELDTFAMVLIWEYLNEIIK